MENEMDLSLSRLPVPGTMMLDTVIEGRNNRGKKKPACSLARDDSFTQEYVTRVRAAQDEGQMPNERTRQINT